MRSQDGEGDGDVVETAGTEGAEATKEECTSDDGAAEVVESKGVDELVRGGK